MIRISPLTTSSMASCIRHAEPFALGNRLQTRQIRHLEALSRKHGLIETQIMHRDIEQEIRAEADRLLDSGLRSVLAGYGEVYVIGSYALRLMTWRDLDIHVVPRRLDKRQFFELGAGIAALLKPHRMHFRDETEAATPGLPNGFYWGVYLADEPYHAWKIDVWAEEEAGFAATRAFGERIAAKLTETSRAAILRIKSAVWMHPEYRRGFTSTDIYSAVLDHGVTDVEGFWGHMRGRSKT